MANYINYFRFLPKKRKKKRNAERLAWRAEGAPATPALQVSLMLLSLPTEVLSLVLTHCCPPRLLSLESCCRTLHQLLAESHGEAAWLEVLRRNKISRRGHVEPRDAYRAALAHTLAPLSFRELSMHTEEFDVSTMRDDVLLGKRVRRADRDALPPSSAQSRLCTLHEMIYVVELHLVKSNRSSLENSADIIWASHREGEGQTPGGGQTPEGAERQRGVQAPEGADGLQTRLRSFVCSADELGHHVEGWPWTEVGERAEWGGRQSSIIISLTEVLKPQRIQPVSPPDCLVSDVSPLAPYWRHSLASNASRPSHHRLPQEYH